MLVTWAVIDLLLRVYNRIVYHVSTFHLYFIFTVIHTKKTWFSPFVSRSFQLDFCSHSFKRSRVLLSGENSVYISCVYRVSFLVREYHSFSFKRSRVLLSVSINSHTTQSRSHSYSIVTSHSYSIAALREVNLLHSADFINIVHNQYRTRCSLILNSIARAWPYCCSLRTNQSTSGLVRWVMSC